MTVSGPIRNPNGKWQLHVEGVDPLPADAFVTISHWSSHSDPVKGTEIGEFNAIYAIDQTPLHPGFSNNTPEESATFATFTGHIYNVPKRDNTAPVMSMVSSGVSAGFNTPGRIAGGYHFATYCGLMTDHNTIVGYWSDISGHYGAIKLSRIPPLP